MQTYLGLQNLDYIRKKVKDSIQTRYRNGLHLLARSTRKDYKDIKNVKTIIAIRGWICIEIKLKTIHKVHCRVFSFYDRIELDRCDNTISL